MLRVSCAGDKNAAIDYYSKGVTELEKGIGYDIHAKGTLTANLIFTFHTAKFLTLRVQERK